MPVSGVSSGTEHGLGQGLGLGLGSTEPPSVGHDIDDRLLAYLPRQLGKRDLAYAARPNRIVGGFDTLVYAFQLDGAPEEFCGPLIVRAFRDGLGGERARWESTV